MSGRPGPAVVGLPEDVIRQQIPGGSASTSQNTRYGLEAYGFMKCLNRGILIGERLETAILCRNGVVVSNNAAAPGAAKQSDLEREDGLESMEEYRLHPTT